MEFVFFLASGLEGLRPGGQKITKTITKTRKDENTKETTTVGKLHLRQINSVTGPEKDRYQFEDLSKKIIGVPIKIDFSCFRTFVFS